MTKLSYSEKLRDPRWQALRLAVFQRDDFKCQYCQDTTTELQVHHHSYYGEPWEAPIDTLTTYCKVCHSIIEDIKKHQTMLLKRIFKFNDRYRVAFCLCSTGSKYFHFYTYENNKPVCALSLDDFDVIVFDSECKSYDMVF